MSAPTTTEDTVLRTTIGDFPLHEYRIALGGREWSVLHTGSVLTRAEETAFLGELEDRLPYGVLLWPAALGCATPRCSPNMTKGPWH